MKTDAVLAVLSDYSLCITGSDPRGAKVRTIDVLHIVSLKGNSARFTH